MALTGKLLADFDSFYAAVQKADVSLKGMETGAGRVSTSLNKMADSFSGRKIVQDATLAAEAVERIGGASKLTASEQARVNATVTEALAKYRALGQEAPQALVSLQEATKKATAGVTDLKSAFSTVAGAIGVGFSVGAIIGFGKGVFDTAGKIHDLAEQMGISTDAVQGFKFAAEQAGSSLDTVSTAITKMNANLDGGDKATVTALKEAGLNFETIRNMKPEDAFLAITDAIQKMPDPMQQSEVALKLFGKSAAELLPAIKEGFRGAAAGADKMSEDTINSLEAAGDAWQKLYDKVVIITGNLIAKTMGATTQISSSIGNFGKFLDDALKMGPAQALALAAAMNEATIAAAKNRDVNLPLEGIHRKTAEQLAAEAEEAKKLAEVYNRVSGAGATQELKRLDQALGQILKTGPLTEAQLQAIGKEAADLAAKGGKLTPRLTEIAIKSGALLKPIEDDAKAFENLGFKIDLAIPKMDAFAEASANLQGKLKIGADALGDAGFKFDASGATGVKDLTKSIKDAQKAIADLSQAFQQLGQIIGGTAGQVVSAMGQGIKAGSDFKAVLDSDADAGAKFAAGAVAVMQMVSALKQATAAGTTAQRALGGALTGAAIGSSILPGYGTLIGAGVGAAAGGIAGALSTAGRQAVKAFAESVGGFEKLHQDMLTRLGAQGEAFWIQLTQKVGEGDQAAAIKTIQQIQAAMAATPQGMTEAAGYQTRAQLQAIADKAKQVYDYMRDSGLYTADAIADAFQKMKDAQIAAMDDAGKAAIDAATKARDAAQKVVDELAGQIKSLQDAVDQEAPEEVMGAVEAQQRAKLESLKKQQEEAQAKVDDLNKQIKDATDAAVAAAQEAAVKAGQVTVTEIQGALDRATFRVKVKVDGIPDGGSGSGGGSGTTPAYATGGYFSTPRMAVIGDAPEFITPRRSIGMLARDIVSAGGVGGGDGSADPGWMPVQLMMPDGSVLIEQMVKVARREGWT